MHHLKMRWLVGWLVGLVKDESASLTPVKIKVEGMTGRGHLLHGELLRT